MINRILSALLALAAVVGLAASASADGTGGLGPVTAIPSNPYSCHPGYVLFLEPGWSLDGQEVKLREYGTRAVHASPDLGLHAVATKGEESVEVDIAPLPLSCADPAVVEHDQQRLIDRLRAKIDRLKHRA